MAIVSVRRKPDARGRVDEQGRRTYEVHYRILVDSLTDGPVAILQAAGIPSQFGPYSTASEIDAGALALSYELDRSPESPYIWDLRVEYSSIHPDPAAVTEHPSQRPTVISYRTERYREALALALDPEDEDEATFVPVVNSAEDPLDPPLEIGRRILVITMRRNELDFDDSTITDWIDHVNTDTWFGYPVGTVRLDDVSAEAQDPVNNLPYHSVTYVFHYKPSGWLEKRLDAGFNEYELGTGAKILARDKYGNPYSQAVPLDGSGHVLDPTVQEPVTLEFKVFYTREFAALNLP